MWTWAIQYSYFDLAKPARASVIEATVIRAEQGPNQTAAGKLWRPETLLAAS
jgi:hypothetical protein